MKQGIVWILLLLGLLAFLLFYFDFFNFKNTSANAIDFFNEDAICILNTENIYNFSAKIDATEYAKTTADIPIVKQVRSELAFLNEIFNADDNNSIAESYIGFYKNNTNGVDALYVFANTSNANIEKLNVENTTSYKFEGNKIFTLKSKEGKLSYAQIGSQALISKNPVLIESAIYHYNNNEPAINQSIVEWGNRSKSMEDAILIVNGRNTNILLGLFATTEISQEQKLPFNWAALGLTLKGNEIIVNGMGEKTKTFNITADKHEKFMLPNTTAWATISGFKINDLPAEVKQFATTWMGKSYCKAKLKSIGANTAFDDYYVVHCDNLNLAAEDFEVEYNSNDAIMGFTTKPQLVKALFEDDFEGQWHLAHSNNQLIFTKSSNIALKITSSQLAEDMFVENSNGQVFYMNLVNAKNGISSIANEHFEKYWTSNASELANFQKINFQISPNDEQLIINGKIQYNTTKKIESGIIWQATLDGPYSHKPTLIANTKTGQNNLLILTDSNSLYLLNGEGTILWKRKFEEEIIPPFHTVNYFNNEAQQIAFTSKNRIYLIDDKGKDLDDFPLRLPSPASSGLSVFTYDQTYQRMFTACENGNIYGYEINGTPLQGWNPMENVGSTTLPIKHVNDEGIDYIITLNDEGSVGIFNRKGERKAPAINFKSTFVSPLTFDAYSKKLVGADVAGNIHYITLDGKHSSDATRSYRRKYEFISSNIVGDNANDMIITNGKYLNVLRDNSTGNQHALYTFTDSVKVDLNLLNNGKMMVVTKDENYLFNQDLKPLQSISEMINSPVIEVELLKNEAPLIIYGSDNNIKALILKPIPAS